MATTYCNTDPKCPDEIREQLNRIEGALGEYATTSDNPCGGAAYYEEGESKPWRLLYCDGAQSEYFATADEAVDAAESYAEEMDAESD
jgi:hypothetical protein